MSANYSDSTSFWDTQMARVRACFCSHIFGIYFFRRGLAHVRRPCFLFGLGVFFLLASVISLNLRTGTSKVVNTGSLNRLSREPIRLNRSGPVNVVVQNASRLVSFPNGSGKNQSSVDRMELQLREMKNKIKVGRFHFKLPPNNKTDSSHFRFRDLAATQAQRQEKMRHVCEAKRLQDERRRSSNSTEIIIPEETAYHEGWYGRKFLYAVTEVYEPQNFFFCPVLKVGSTFFRRLFYAFSHGMTIASPYEISINTALSQRSKHPKDLLGAPKLHNAELQSYNNDSLHDLDLRAPPGERQEYGPEEDKRMWQFLNNSGKVMFTRNPYTKLLSGYMDKLFAPNPYFWSTVGRFIVKKFRPQASLKSLNCGHDVTFPEFIKYVIENERANSLHRDTHFVPSYDQCKPCDFPYDVIGKMETFATDVSLVVAQLGHNLSQSTLDTWNLESEADAISDSIMSAYSSWRRQITKCMTWKEANHRIWRKLQTRGIVDKNEPLPMARFPQYSSSSLAFINTVKISWREFRTSGLKSQQKKEALSSAYSVVPREDLELVREYFSLDFDLFGYDPKPDAVFKSKHTWDVFSLTGLS